MTETTMTETALESFTSERGHDMTETTMTESVTPDAGSSENSAPALTIVFRVLAALEMFGGLILCINLWPADAGIGYDWKPVAYVAALTWLFAGLVFGFLFWAIGDVLRYLRDIHRSLERGK